MYQQQECNTENININRQLTDRSMEHDASMNCARWEKATLVTGSRWADSVRNGRKMTVRLSALQDRSSELLVCKSHTLMLPADNTVQKKLIPILNLPPPSLHNVNKTCHRMTSSRHQTPICCAVIFNPFTPSHPNNFPAHNPPLHHVNIWYQTIRSCCFLLHLQSGLV